MINSEKENSMIAGTVIATPEAKLGWTPSKSQPVSFLVNSGKIAFGNRAVSERDGRYFVKARNKSEVEVVKIGDGKYEVVVNE